MPRKALVSPKDKTVKKKQNKKKQKNKNRYTPGRGEKCSDKSYKGETGRKFNTRMREHQKDANDIHLQVFVHR